ncbi:hypothetical protein ACFVUS_12355 [Nocardia sp. NPDC058058]|uniref:hypothetical protein n=1 Tax=Nocardia sp. NPDC058058 TaxID=3346317 RepID=UPI0036DCE697
MSTKDAAPQPIPLGADREYTAWLGQIDHLLRTRFGLKFDAITYDWRTDYDRGQSPVTAAAMAVMSR